MRFAPGDVVGGRYELARLIGHGGEGAVFDAVQRFTEQHVALKVAVSRGDALARWRGRMLQEAKTLGALRHPGIVTILDAGLTQPGDVPYLALELLEGKTLETLLATRGPLPIEGTVAIMMQICDAIEFAHRAGVLHRDLKPSNIIVCRDALGHERVKILDFGTAKSAILPDAKLTDAGVPIGTLAYMSPEQLYGRTDLDARTDVYALGTILYECVTGQAIHRGSLGKMLSTALFDESPQSLRDSQSAIEPDLYRVMHTAVVADRNARYGSVADFAHALHAIHNRATLRVLDPPRSPSPADDQRTSPRAPYFAEVRIIASVGMFHGRTEDISEGGFLLMAAHGLEAGEEVAVELGLPHGGTLRCGGTVQWVTQPRPSGARAVGVAFAGVPDAALSEIRGYVMARMATQ